MTQNQGTRVCMVVRSAIAHDARVRKEAATLAGAGYGVTVVGLGSQDSTEMTPDGVRIETVAFNPGYDKVGRSRRLIRAMRAEPALARRMKARVSSEYFDVVHAHDLDAFSTARSLAKPWGALLVFDSHELYAEAVSWSIMRPALKWYERRAISNADLVITANDERARVYADEYGARTLPTPIINAPRLTDASSEPLPDAIAARKETGARFLMLYQGGLGRARGLDALVGGLCQLPDDYHLALMGPEGLATTLMPLAKELGVETRIHYWPAVATEQVIGWAAVADAGVVSYTPTNRNNELCAPNKLYEYAAAGIRVLCADLPPLRSALERFKFGELFIPGDATSLAEATVRVSALSREDARTAGLELLRERGWERQETTLLDAYKDLLRRNDVR